MLPAVWGMRRWAGLFAMLLHHQHQEPWRGLPDLDLVVEGSAELANISCSAVVRAGVELRKQLRNGGLGAGWGAVGWPRLVRRYPARIQSGGARPARLDLARRDFTVNALALELPLDQWHLNVRWERLLISMVEQLWLASAGFYAMQRGGRRARGGPCCATGRLGFSLAPKPFSRS